MPWTAWLLLGAVVAWCLGAGVAFRLGHLRRLGRWYADERLPGLVRFLPLELAPIGTFLGCAGAAAAIAPEEGEDASALGLGLFLGIFVALGWWVWTCFRPARFLMPEWLREIEEERRAERRPSVR